MGTLYQDYLLQLRDGFKDRMKQVQEFKNKSSLST